MSLSTDFGRNTASYILYSGSGNIYARNGTTGVVGYSGSNVSATIESIITDDDQLVFLKKGDYSITNLTISKRVHFVGEDGAKIILTAKPCITINTGSIFENIEIYSTVDGYRHVVINGDVDFRNCKFNLPISTGETQCVMEVDSTTGNTIQIDNCTLIGGTSGSNYFGLLRINDGKYTKNLRINNFRAPNIIADGTNGRIAVIVVSQTTGRLDFAQLNDIVIEKVETSYGGSTFFYVGTGTTVGDVEMHNFEFLDADFTGPSPADAYFSPITCFVVINSLMSSNWRLLKESHPVIQAKQFTLNGLVMYSELSSAGLDLGSNTQQIPCHALLNNLYFSGSSCGTGPNNGWVKTTITNSQFVDTARFLVLDEIASSLKRHVVLSNCTFSNDSTISLAGNLASVQLSNIKFVDCSYGINGTTSVDEECLLMMDNVQFGPREDGYWPRFMNYTRDSNLTIWMFNSDITTQAPPFNNCNPMTSSDKIDNVRFLRTIDSAVLYSENRGTLTLSSQSGSVAHSLAASPGSVSLSVSGSASNMYMGGLGWYPSGSAGIWVVQTGSGTVYVNWVAEL